MRIRNYFFCATVLFVFSSAQAGSLTINTSNPDLKEIFSVSHLINANDIEGLTATVTFADLTEENALWGATGGTSGGAFGTGWSLSSTGNALFGATLLNSGSQAIVDILLSGFAPNIAFDLGDTYGTGRTAGAGVGSPFTVIDSSEDLDIVANYADAVFLSGSPANGDLFSGLQISINSGGLKSGDFLTFSTDVDFVDRDGSSTPVPEPAPLMLLGLGLTVLSLRRKRTLRMEFL
jgi:PEP-CTERM motif